MSAEPDTLRYDELFNDPPCGYLVFDGDGKILATNGRLQDWLGMSVSELNDSKMSRIFSTASRAIFETSVMPLLSLQGQVEGASLDIQAKDGEIIPVLLSAESYSDGSRPQTKVAFLKASARRELERQLAKERAEAEADLALKQREGELREQFVAILGHDLRNPLASISSAVRILSRETLSEKSKEIVQLTQGSVLRMSRLIDNVLDFARGRLGGGIKLELSDGTALEDQMKQLVQEFHLVAPERDIQLSFSLRHAVRCDVWRIGQLSSNLLGNAMAYGDPAHAVQVVVRTLDEGDLEISFSNRGAPIPPSALERLFDPFVRSSESGNSKGLGLGLYIALEIAKAHGGTLDVFSTDQQTTFTFRMPSGGAEQETDCAPRRLKS